MNIGIILTPSLHCLLFHTPPLSYESIILLSSLTGTNACKHETGMIQRLKPQDFKYSSVNAHKKSSQSLRSKLFAKVFK